MLTLKQATLSAVSVVLLSATMAAAQRPSQATDDPRLKQPAPKTEVKTGANLTIDEIGQLLKNMGYQFKVNRQNNNNTIIELDIPSNGRVVALDIELSVDKKKVWLSSWFKTLSGGETIPSNIMMQMLESNARFGPCHFAVSTAKQLNLACPMDNRNLTTEELRRQIDIFLSVHGQTEHLWNSSKWSVPGPNGR